MDPDQTLSDVLELLDYACAETREERGDLLAEARDRAEYLEAWLARCGYAPRVSANLPGLISALVRADLPLTAVRVAQLEVLPTSVDWLRGIRALVAAIAYDTRTRGTSETAHMR